MEIPIKKFSPTKAPALVFYWGLEATTANEKVIHGVEEEEVMKTTLIYSMNELSLARQLKVCPFRKATEGEGS